MKSPLRYIDELAIDNIFQPVSMRIYNGTWVNNYRLAKWFIFFASVVLFYQSYLLVSKNSYIGALICLACSFTMFSFGRKAAKHAEECDEGKTVLVNYRHGPGSSEVFWRRTSLIFVILFLYLFSTAYLSGKALPPVSNLNLILTFLCEVSIWIGLSFLACIPPPPRWHRDFVPVST